MTPTFQINLMTIKGEATIRTEQPWDKIGEYSVTGPGTDLAREWVENAFGAFGHPIGQWAAPLDLHRAAMMLQQEAQPEDDVWLDSIEGDVQEYNSGVPEGKLT